jgi:hypothetical protein
LSRYEASISLGSNDFPVQARSTLNAFVNALVRRVSRLAPKEVAIYLTHSLAVGGIRQLKQRAGIVQQESKEEKIERVRRACREVRWPEKRLSLSLLDDAYFATVKAGHHSRPKIDNGFFGRVAAFDRDSDFAGK